jgi:hypothetical protein
VTPPTGDASDVDDTVLAQLPAQRLAMHASNLPLALGGSALAAVVLAVLQAPSVGARVAFGWLASFAALMACLAGLGIAYRRATRRDTPAKPWLRRYRASVLAHGMAWGSAGLALYPVPGYRIPVDPRAGALRRGRERRRDDAAGLSRDADVHRPDLGATGPASAGRRGTRSTTASAAWCCRTSCSWR